MSLPRVSIVIPVYNGSNYLASAIDCALQQSYKNLEIIVINDGSTDNGATEKIALSYGDSIHYFYKPNGGVSSALNYGIEKMTGEYFSWLSHDDMYAPEKIEDSINLLNDNGLIGKKCVAFTSGYFIDCNQKRLGKFHKYFNKGEFYSGLDVAKIMTKKGTLNGCCMLIPKSAFAECGGFDESLKYSQDSLMWYKIFLAGYSLISDNLPNVMYRLHNKQASQCKRDLYEHDALEIAKILSKPLAMADKGNKFLLRYIKRLTKYQCGAAIDYLYNYGTENDCLSFWDRLEIKLFNVFGFFRYRIVKTLKRALICIRR